MTCDEFLPRIIAEIGDSRSPKRLILSAFSRSFDLND